MVSQKISLQDNNQPLSVDLLRSALKKQCEDRVANLYSDVFDHRTYSVSGLENLFKSNFESGTPSITLLGPPGIGKSTLLCKLALEWSDTSLVFFTDARELEKSRETFDRYILKKCSEIAGFDLKSGFENFKNLLQDQKTFFYIIVDSVELASTFSSFYNSFNNMQLALLHNQIKFLNACDDHIYYQDSTKFFDRSTSIFTWPNFSGAGCTVEKYFRPLMRSYFTNYEITTELTGKARQWVGIPLFLKLFSEVYQNQSMRRVETLKLKYLFDRFIATFCQKIAAIRTNQELDTNVIAGFMERCALLVFQQKSDEIPLARFNEAMACYSSEIISELLILFTNTSVCTIYTDIEKITVIFHNLLLHSYLIARKLVSEMNWDTCKPEKDIVTDLAALIKLYDESMLFPFVIQSLYLILESLGKNNIFIHEFSQEKYRPKYKAILLRCFGWQNEMTVSVWQAIKLFERENDRQVVAALYYLNAMIFEKIPDDITMEILSLPDSPDEKVRSELLSRLNFDPTLSRMVMQLKPYCHLSEVQSGILRIVDLFKTDNNLSLSTGLLNLIELVLGFDLHKGIELMRHWQKYATSDIGALNMWCDIACKNALAIFPDFWEIYVLSTRNDRQGGNRIVQFCISGGQSAPSTALALIQKFWHLNTNMSLREKTYAFINEYGNLNTAASLKILCTAKKENDSQSSPHKMVIREMICNASITCFEKQPSAFMPLMQEWLTHDDVKVKLLVTESLRRFLEKSKT